MLESKYLKGRSEPRVRHVFHSERSGPAWDTFFTRNVAKKLSSKFFCQLLYYDMIFIEMMVELVMDMEIDKVADEVADMEVDMEVDWHGGEDK